MLRADADKRKRAVKMDANENWRLVKKERSLKRIYLMEIHYFHGRIG